MPYEPRCVVAELGANDALRATFADAHHQPRRAADIRRAAADNIAHVLSTARSIGIPIVLVTASEYPVTAYGAGLTYAHEAAQVNATIRSLAKSSQGNVVLADWAALSAKHHSPHPFERSIASGGLATTGIHDDVRFPTQEHGNRAVDPAAQGA